jgi:predicted transcriptional regulator
MTVNEIVQALNLKTLAGSRGLKNEIAGGYTSDLLSDVMGNSEPGTVWVTLQTHKNVIAVASLKDHAAVIIVNSHTPNPETIAQAEEEGIPLLSTKMSAFEVSGKLYHLITTKTI